MASRRNSSIWLCIFSQNRGGAKTICGATSRMSLDTVPAFSGKWTISPSASWLKTEAIRSAMWHSGRKDSDLSPGLASRYSPALVIWNTALRLAIIAPLGAPVVPEV